VLVVDTSAVGAGLDAVLAAHTCLFVDQYHTAGVVVGGLGGTYLFTGGILTVLALDGKAPTILFALLFQAVDIAGSLGEVIALAASLKAGPAPRALVEVDDEGIFGLHLSLCLGPGDPPAPGGDQEATAQAGLQEGST
jgi:hypothetical protein